MPTFNFSLNINPNEPRTFWKLPVTTAILFIQISIILFFVGLAFELKRYEIALLSAVQLIITLFFISDLYYVILVHFCAQIFGFLGLVLWFFDAIWRIGIRKSEATNIEIFTAWYMTIIGIFYIYYMDLVYQNILFIEKQRKAANLRRSAPHNCNNA